MPRYAKNPDVVLREVEEDGGLLFNPDTNSVRILNETGLFVWNMCDGSHDLTSIITAVQAAFEGASPDTVHTDVAKFLNNMVSASLVGIVEG